MRLLLKKGTAWVWLPEHEEDFVLVKKTLTSEKAMVKPFDADLQTILLMDASISRRSRTGRSFFNN